MKARHSHSCSHHSHRSVRPSPPSVEQSPDFSSACDCIYDTHRSIIKSSHPFQTKVDFLNTPSATNLYLLRFSQIPEIAHPREAFSTALKPYFGAILFLLYCGVRAGELLLVTEWRHFAPRLNLSTIYRSSLHLSLAEYLRSNIVLRKERSAGTLSRIDSMSSVPASQKIAMPITANSTKLFSAT